MQWAFLTGRRTAHSKCSFYLVFSRKLSKVMHKKTETMMIDQHNSVILFLCSQHNWPDRVQLKAELHNRSVMTKGCELN